MRKGELRTIKLILWIVTTTHPWEDFRFHRYIPYQINLSAWVCFSLIPLCPTLILWDHSLGWILQKKAFQWDTPYYQDFFLLLHSRYSIYFLGPIQHQMTSTRMGYIQISNGQISYLKSFWSLWRYEQIFEEHL